MGLRRVIRDTPTSRRAHYSKKHGQASLPPISLPLQSVFHQSVVRNAMPMHCPICRKGHWWNRTGAPAVDSTRPNLGRQHRIAAGSTRPRAHNGLVQLSQDSRQSFPSIFRISVAGSFVVALSRSFRTVRSESPHNCAISVTRRPRRRSRFIRSTTSGVTFKSPPRRTLGIPSGTAEFGLLNH
jgi:hypothetical protein